MFRSQSEESQIFNLARRESSDVRGRFLVR